MSYKAKLPVETINTIRTKLTNLDIFITEQDFFCHAQNIYSCRTIVDNPKFRAHNIGTNGKGSTPQYTLASSYGELMERIQSGFLFKKNNIRKLLWEFKTDLNFISESLNIEQDLLLPLFINKNEFLIYIDDISQEQKKIFCDLFKDNENEIIELFSYSDQLICSNFLNLKSKKIYPLPVEIIDYVCGTNGLCAGNTKDEAIGQGLLEILERFSMKQIFKEKITPPSIPLDFFINSNGYKFLSGLTSNYKVIIKDISLGRGFPVIGLIIINLQTGKYGFSMGAHLNANIALERCITEFHQGGTEGWYRELDREIDLPSHKEFLNQFRVSNGKLPNTFFESNYSYKFDKSIYQETDSIRNNTNKIVSLLIDQGEQIYIQDISYLGFPTFRIFIPGLSEINPVSRRQKLVTNSIDRLIPYISKLKNLKYKEIKYLLNIIEDIGELKKNFYRDRMFYVISTDISEMVYPLMITLLFYKIKDYTNSYFYFCEYLKSTKSDNLYYRIVKDFLFYRKKNYCIKDIITLLDSYYEPDLVLEVVNDLEDNSKAFSYYSLPTCFECKNCKLSENCILESLININIKLSELHDNFTPNYSIP